VGLVHRIALSLVSVSTIAGLGACSDAAETPETPESKQVAEVVVEDLEGTGLVECEPITFEEQQYHFALCSTSFSHGAAMVFSFDTEEEVDDFLLDVELNVFPEALRSAYVEGGTWLVQINDISLMEEMETLASATGGSISEVGPPGIASKPPEEDSGESNSRVLQISAPQNAPIYSSADSIMTMLTDNQVCRSGSVDSDEGVTFCEPSEGGFVTTVIKEDFTGVREFLNNIAAAPADGEPDVVVYGDRWVVVTASLTLAQEIQAALGGGELVCVADCS
jgi:hypothetical protein